MTALTDLTDLKDALAYPTHTVHGLKTTVAQFGTPGGAGGFISSWTYSGFPGAGTTPSAAVATDSSSTGAIPLPTFSNQLWLTHALLSHSNISGPPDAGYGWAMLCDRLSHSGGLSGTLNTTQTTNLPTAALTRYTSGDGVHAALEYYSAVGTNSGVTATASYTNQAGTAARTSLAIAANRAAGWGMTGNMHPIPLQVGDSGFKSVESVTLSATTGTAGNFGVTLYKPLASWPLNAPVLTSGIDLAGNIPEITASACLFWVIMQYNAQQNGATGIDFFYDLGFTSR